MLPPDLVSTLPLIIVAAYFMGYGYIILDVLFQVAVAKHCGLEISEILIGHVRKGWQVRNTPNLIIWLWWLPHVRRVWYAEYDPDIVNQKLGHWKKLRVNLKYLLLTGTFILVFSGSWVTPWSVALGLYLLWNAASEHIL